MSKLAKYSAVVISLALIMGFAAQSVSAGKGNRKVQSENSKAPEENAFENRITVRVVNGDTINYFLITKIAGKAKIKMTGPQIKDRENNLDDADFVYILNEIEKLPSGKKLPDYCVRARMGIVIEAAGKKSQHKASCYGIDAKKEEKFRHIGTILQLAI